jgi:D-alanine-D-alanine ligase-like ATP-grasp enzyme
VKPNVGGSGAGIVSFESPESLGAAAKAGELEFGPDDTALVQEHLTAEDDAIVRIEFLDGEFLYAIRLRLTPGTFNLCPADYCGILGAADTNDEYAPIEAFKPSPEIIKDAKRLLDATGADLGGVEYLIDAASGEASFYDINALSNFVADAQTIIGFDPFIDLVDFIADRIGYD